MGISSVFYRQFSALIGRDVAVILPILGCDRTGVVSAMYHMVFQGWSREAAMDEFINGGYSYHQRFYPNIESYLENVDIDAMRKQLEQDIGRAIPLQESLGGFSAVSTPVVQRALP